MFQFAAEERKFLTHLQVEHIWGSAIHLSFLVRLLTDWVSTPWSLPKVLYLFARHWGLFVQVYVLGCIDSVAISIQVNLVAGFRHFVSPTQMTMLSG